MDKDNDKLKSKKKTPISYVLEPRVMLDAAAVETGMQALAAAEAQKEAEEIITQSGQEADSQFEDVNDLLDAVSSESVHAEGKAIVIIDSAVEDADILTAGLQENAEVFVLDAQTDGLEQIAHILANQNDVASLHIVSHGDAGSLSLGQGQINFASLTEAQQQALAAIGDGLLANADILVYGCDFGTGERGQNAVSTLAELTGADIAASDDRTGSVQLEADWQFEVTRGTVETAIIFDATSASAYTHTLFGTPDGFTLKREDGVDKELSFAENNNVANQSVGFISVRDEQDSSAGHYSLAAGDGDSDNDLFEFKLDAEGNATNELVLKEGSLNSDQGTYSIRIRAVDYDGVVFEDTIDLTVTSTGAPTDIELQDPGTEDALSSVVPVTDLTYTPKSSAAVFAEVNDGYKRTSTNAYNSNFGDQQFEVEDQVQVSFNFGSTITNNTSGLYAGFGLDAVSRDSARYYQGSYVIRYVTGAAVRVSEDGALKGTNKTITAGDTLEIKMASDGTVTYWHNDSVFYTSTSKAEGLYRTIGGQYYKANDGIENITVQKPGPVVDEALGDADQTVLKLAAIDLDDTAWTYSLVAGSGDTHNASFEIGGTNNDELILTAFPDYRTTPVYSVRVRATDAYGHTYDEIIEVDVIKSQTPTDIHIFDADGAELNLTGFTGDVSKVDLTEDSITKTAALGWNTNLVSDARFSASSEDVNVSFKSSDAGVINGMYGLNASGTSAHYAQIDYAVYFVSGTLQIRENGVSKGNLDTYTTSDVFSVNIDSDTGTVTYLKNGSVFYTSLTKADLNAEYWFEAAPYSKDSGITDLSFALKPTILEASGTNQTIAKLTTDDVDSSEFTYSLAEGTGSDDNAKFTIGGTNNDELIITENTNFDTQSSYSVRVRTTDPQGNEYDEVYVVKVIENTAPTDIGAVDGTTGETIHLASSFVSAKDFTETNGGYLPDANGYLYAYTEQTATAQEGEISTSFTFNSTTRASTSGVYGAAGLDSASSPAADYRNIDYAIRFISTTQVRVYEANVAKSTIVTITAGAKLEVRVSDAGIVRYYADDTLFYVSGTVAEGEYQHAGGSYYAATYGGVEEVEFSAVPGLTVVEASGANQVIADLSAVDENSEVFSYELVAGTGDSDNTKFTLDANTGELVLTEDPDFATQSSYSIRVKVTDHDDLTYEKEMTVSVLENTAPTDIQLFNPTTGVEEGVPTFETEDDFTLINGGFKNKSGNDYMYANSVETATVGDSEVSASFSFSNKITNNTGGAFGAAGLDSASSPATDYRRIDYSIRYLTANSVRVYEANTARGSAETVERWAKLEIKIDTDGTVTYLNDGEVFYTSTVTASGDYQFAGGNYYAANNGIEDVKFSGVDVKQIETSDTGLTVATLASKDSDSTSFTYELVTGDGDTDNASFSISGDELVLTGEPDFTTQETYYVRLRTTDHDGQTYEEAIKVTVLENQAPTDIVLKDSTTDETIGELTYSSEHDFVEANDGFKNETGNNYMYVHTDQNVLVGADPIEGSFSFGSTITNNASGTNAAAGLDSADSPAAGFRQIDYSFRYINGTTVRVYEANTARDQNRTITAGETLSIKVDADGEVTYYTGDTLVYTSTVTASGNYHFAGGNYVATNDGIENVEFTGQANPVEEATGAGQVVAKLTATDVDSSVFTYELVAGDGDTDNDLFSIGGTNSDELTLTPDPDKTTHGVLSIRVKVTDHDGKSYEEIIRTNILGNDAPTDIIVAESSTDPNVGDITLLTEDEGSISVGDRELTPELILTDEITKLEETDAWDVGVRSAEGGLASDGVSVAALASQTDKLAAFGLSASADPLSSYDEIDYAVYFADDGTVQVFEKGVSKGTFGTYTTEDVLKVDIATDGTVTYLKNGELFYTSTTAATLDADYHFNASIYHEEAAINSVDFSAADDLQPIGGFDFVSDDGYLKANNGFKNDTGNGYIYVASDETRLVGDGEGIKSSFTFGSPITTTFAAAGLDLASSPAADYRTIDYSIRTNSATNVRVYEGNTLRVTQTAAAGDTFGIEIATDGTVTYLQNGTVFYTSTVDATVGDEYQFAGGNYYAANAGIENITFNGGAIRIAEQIGANKAIATLKDTVDADSDTFTYALVSGDGDTDNAKFSINANNELVLAEDPIYDTQSSYSVRVQTTDHDGLTYEKVIRVEVIGNQPPADITVTDVNNPDVDMAPLIISGEKADRYETADNGLVKTSTGVQGYDILASTDAAAVSDGIKSSFNFADVARATYARYTGIGLDSSSTAATDYRTIDFSVRYYTGTQVRVYEANALKGTFAVNPFATIEINVDTDGTVTYEQDGVAFYTSATTASGSYTLSGGAYFRNYGFENLTFSGTSIKVVEGTGPDQVLAQLGVSDPDSAGENEGGYFDEEDRYTATSTTLVYGDGTVSGEKWLKDATATAGTGHSVNTKDKVLFSQNSVGSFDASFTIEDADLSSEMIMGFTANGEEQPGTTDYAAGTTSVDFGVYYDSGAAYAFVNGDLNETVWLGDTDVEYKIEVDNTTGVVNFYTKAEGAADFSLSADSSADSGDFTTAYTVAVDDYSLTMNLDGPGDGFDNINLNGEQQLGNTDWKYEIVHAVEDRFTNHDTDGDLLHESGTKEGEKWYKESTATADNTDSVDTKDKTLFTQDGSGTFSVTFNVLDADNSSELVLGFTDNTETQPGTTDYDTGATSVDFGVYADGGFVYGFVNGDLNNVVVLGENDADYKIEVDNATGVVNFYSKSASEETYTLVADSSAASGDFDEYLVAAGDYALDMNFDGPNDGFDNIVFDGEEIESALSINENNQLVLNSDPEYVDENVEYTAVVRVTDSHGKVYEETVKIDVLENLAPTDIMIAKVNAYGGFDHFGFHSSYPFVEKEGGFVSGKNGHDIVRTTESVAVSDGISSSFNFAEAARSVRYQRFSAAGLDAASPPRAGNYLYIDYSIRPYTANSVRIYEAGVYKKTVAASLLNDTFEITVDTAGKVKYLRNGELVYTSKTTATKEYLFTAGAYFKGDGVENVGFTGNSLKFDETLTPGDTIVSLSSVDTDSTSWTYTLPADVTDNDHFQIGGDNSDELQLAIQPDYETKTSYSVTVRSTDNHGNSYDEVFNYTLVDVAAPTDLILGVHNKALDVESTSGVVTTSQDWAGNPKVYEQRGTDQYAARVRGVDGHYQVDELTYSLVTGTGDDDNAKFSLGGLNGNDLILSENPDYDTQTQYKVRIRVTNPLGETYEEEVLIDVVQLTTNVHVNDSISDGTKEYSINGVRTRAVDAGNFDDEADIEILAALQGEGQSGELVIYDNDNNSTNSDSGFTQYVLATFADQKIKDVEVADLDGDGDMDIVGLGQKGKIKVLINDGTNDVTDNFTETEYTITAPANTLSVTAGDFDGDSALDIAIATGNKVMIFGDIVNGVDSLREHEVTGGSRVFTVGTLKTSGVDKIVYGTYRGDGGGVFSFDGNDETGAVTTLLAADSDRFILDLEIAQDDNNSGYIAAAARGKNDDTLNQAHVWTVTSGTAGDVTSLGSGLVRPRAVGFTDVDGDGDMDLVLAGADSTDTAPYWYRNSSSATGTDVDDDGSGTFLETFDDNTNPNETTNSSATTGGMAISTAGVTQVADIITTNITGKDRGTVKDSVAHSGSTDAGDQTRGHGAEVFFGGKTDVSFVRNVFNDFVYHDVYDLGSKNSTYIIDPTSDISADEDYTGSVGIGIGFEQEGDVLEINGVEVDITVYRQSLTVVGSNSYRIIDGTLYLYGDAEGGGFADSNAFLSVLKTIKFSTTSTQTGDRIFAFLDGNDNTFARTTLEVRPGRHI